MSAVEEYIWQRPEPQSGLLLRLRKLLLTASPKMREKIRYNVPFYGCPRWFCYTNPFKNGSVEVCFLNGYKLSNEQSLLVAHNRQTDGAGRHCTRFGRPRRKRRSLAGNHSGSPAVGGTQREPSRVFKKKMTTTADAPIQHSTFRIQNSLPLMEAFYTLQGEGFHQGRAAYFIRLAGCDVGCHWCDVKESWNADRHPKVNIADIVSEATRHPARLAVVTGGEPLMHDLTDLTAQLRVVGFKTNIETSGAYPLTGQWDWICLSPKKFKKPTEEVYHRADELKVIVFNRNDFAYAEAQAARVRPGCQLLLQPEWGKSAQMLPLMIEYVKANPQWRISLQTHKFMDIP